MCACVCVVSMGSARRQCVWCVFVLGLMYVCVCVCVCVCVHCVYGQREAAVCMVRVCVAFDLCVCVRCVCGQCEVAVCIVCVCVVSDVCVCECVCACVCVCVLCLWAARGGGAYGWILSSLLSPQKCANATPTRTCQAVICYSRCLTCASRDLCCSVLQRVAACCSVLQRVAAWCSVLQRVAVSCSVLQCQ